MAKDHEALRLCTSCIGRKDIDRGMRYLTQVQYFYPETELRRFEGRSRRFYQIPQVEDLNREALQGAVDQGICYQYSDLTPQGLNWLRGRSPDSQLYSLDGQERNPVDHRIRDDSEVVILDDESASETPLRCRSKSVRLPDNRLENFEDNVEETAEEADQNLEDEVGRAEVDNAGDQMTLPSRQHPRAPEAETLTNSRERNVAGSAPVLAGDKISAQDPPSLVADQERDGPHAHHRRHGRPVKTAISRSASREHRESVDLDDELYQFALPVDEEDDDEYVPSRRAPRKRPPRQKKAVKTSSTPGKSRTQPIIISSSPEIQRPRTGVSAGPQPSGPQSAAQSESSGRPSVLGPIPAPSSNRSRKYADRYSYYVVGGHIIRVLDRTQRNTSLNLHQGTIDKIMSGDVPRLYKVPADEMAQALATLDAAIKKGQLPPVEIVEGDSSSVSQAGHGSGQTLNASGSVRDDLVEPRGIKRKNSVGERIERPARGRRASPCQGAE